MRKKAENVPVGSTILTGRGKAARVTKPSTVTQNDFTVLGRRYQGQTVTVHTNKGDILTTLPCDVEVVD
jgi:hypothetical protein